MTEKINEMTVGIPCVMDSNGVYWYYEHQRIKVVASCGCCFDAGGYHCSSLEDGIRILKQDGYIFD